MGQQAVDSLKLWLPLLSAWDEDVPSLDDRRRLPTLKADTFSLSLFERNPTSLDIPFTASSTTRLARLRTQAQIPFTSWLSLRKNFALYLIELLRFNLSHSTGNQSPFKLLQFAFRVALGKPYSVANKSTPADPTICITNRILQPSIFRFPIFTSSSCLPYFKAPFASLSSDSHPPAYPLPEDPTNTPVLHPATSRSIQSKSTDFEAYFEASFLERDFRIRWHQGSLIAHIRTSTLLQGLLTSRGPPCLFTSTLYWRDTRGSSTYTYTISHCP